MIKCLLFIFISSFAHSAATTFEDELIQRGDYFRAMTIAKGKEYSNRGTAKGFDAQRKVLEIQIRSQDFENFDLEVDDLMNRYKGFFTVPTSADYETDFLMSNFGLAYAKIRKVEAPLEKKYLFRAYAEESEDLPGCDSPNCNLIKAIHSEMATKARSKNTTLAAILGIVPGMGQVYAGHASSGLASFILNGFFAAISITAFNNGEEALGLASATVGTTFYLSSIYAGYETARRFNDSEKENAKRKLQNVPIKLDLINIVF